MSLITEAKLRSLANRRLAASFRDFADGAETILKEARDAAPASFDVFLSHSIRDAQIVLGAYELLKEQGLTVYVDWIEDKGLDRGKVTPATAEQLRRRLRQSKSLIYLHSNNSPVSKWMPWELGYFDGYRGVVAILPIAKKENETFADQEYLGLYPYIDGSEVSTWINKGSSSDNAAAREDRSFRDLKEWWRIRTKIA